MGRLLPVGARPAAGQPGTWRLIVEGPRRPDGSRTRPQETFRGTERQAVRRLRAFELEVATRAAAPAALTLRQVFDRYLTERLRPHGAPTTYASQRTALLTAARSVHGLKLADLRRHHLESLEAAMRDRGLSPVSIGGYLAAVKSALDWAEEVELIARSPAARWRIRRPPPPEAATLDLAQARRLVAALDTWERTEYRLPVLCLLLTGLRLSELRGWRWADLDLDRGTYRVQQQRYRASGQEHVRERPKTRAGQRGGGLPAELVERLRQHREAQRFARAAAGRAWREHGLVFPGEDGEPFAVTAFRFAFYRLLAAAGLPRVRLHGLRHTAVSLQLDAGVPLHEVSRLAGHASPAVTQAVYTHLSVGAGIRAAERLWGTLTATEETPPGGRHGAETGRS